MNKKTFMLLKFLVSVVLLNMGSGCMNSEVNNAKEPSVYERIVIKNETANKGVFDPSVEYNKDGSKGWLVYSGLEQEPEEINYHYPKYIHTHLAKSIDGGKNWIFIKRINESKEGVISSPLFKKILDLESDILKGTWHHEVPTLVHDPDDPGGEWKLFWHKYFSIDRHFIPGPDPITQQRHRILTHSWIMYKRASSPEGLATAEEIKLFATGTAQTKAKYNFDDYTGFKGITVYSEPGSLYKDGVLYVTLSWFSAGKRDQHRLILLASADHGKTWDYAGVVIDDDDARSLGRYVRFTGSALAEEDGRMFLLICPIKKRIGYDGAYIFEFEDITKGKLKRNNKGKLIVYKHLKQDTQKRLNGGQSEYDKHNTYGGIIMSQADILSAPKVGQIYSTKEKIIP